MAEKLHASRTLMGALAVATVVATAASGAPGPVLLSGVVLGLGVFMLWPTTDSPIMLLPFGLQWLSVSVKPILTIFTGQPLDELADFGGGLTASATFGLLGVLALAAGMRLGAGRPRLNWSVALERDAARWSERSIVEITLCLIVLGHILDVASIYAGPARQIFLAFSEVRQAGLFVLAYWALSTGGALGILAIVVVLEIVFGMTGFFANFREALLVLLVAAATARPRFGAASVIAGTIALSLIFAVTIFWSAIKPDYRAFLNEGTGRQVVTQPLSERFGYIRNAATRIDAAQYQEGIRKLIARTSYIDFLAKTLENVPAYVPHQNGRQVAGTVVHILTPRILFPNKPATPDDTKVTAHFTGLDLNIYAGASISIGYLGELYIDFGFIGGIVGSLFIGFLAGWTYRSLRNFDGIPLTMTYGIMIMALLPFSIFESALIKFAGSAVTLVIAAFVLQRMVAPLLLPNVLRERAPAPV